MEKRLSIVIADAHLEWCEILKNQLEYYPFFSVIGVFQDGSSALEFIMVERPEIIFLDIILPGADGLYIINKVRSAMKNYHPFICIISAIGTTKTIRLLKDTEVDYFFIKPINSKIVVENIYRLVQENRTKTLSEADNLMQHDIRLKNSQTLNKDRMISEIDDFIYEAGIPLHLTGARSLRECILFSLVNKDQSAIMYSSVAKTLKFTYSKVERSIRHASEVAMRNATQLYGELIGINQRQPNKELITTLTVHFRRMMLERYGCHEYNRLINEIRDY